MSNPQYPSFGQRLWLAFVAFLRAFIRLLVMVLTILLFAALIYFGVPMLYEQYLSPMEGRLAAVEHNQTLEAQSLDHLQAALDDLSQRMTQIELDNDTTKQLLDSLSIQATQLVEAQATQMAHLLATQQRASDDLAQLNESLSQLETRLSALEETLEAMDTEISSLKERVAHLELSPAGQLTLEKVYNELQLVKAMELLTRSRFSLVQNNFGLAEQDLEAALHILVELKVPEAQQETLDRVIEHLKDAMRYLPDSPVLAAEALELAWQLLKLGLPESATTTPTASSTPLEGFTLTPMATLSPASTPTPTPIP